MTKPPDKIDKHVDAVPAPVEAPPIETAPVEPTPQKHDAPEFNLVQPAVGLTGVVEPPRVSRYAIWLPPIAPPLTRQLRHVLGRRRLYEPIVVDQLPVWRLIDDDLDLVVDETELSFVGTVQPDGLEV